MKQRSSDGVADGPGQLTQFPHYPFLVRDNLSAQRSAVNPPSCLSLAGLRFHDLGRGKFPIPVGLGAQGTRVQFTSFPDRCTTGSTRHG